MRFVIWNINGLRTLKNNFKQLFDLFNAQIICFQETKLSRNLVEDWMAFIPNYSSYFSFPKHKTGYSGCVSYCSDTIRPFGVADSLLEWNEILHKYSDKSLITTNNGNKLFSEMQTKSDLRLLDCEGRVIVSKHLVGINDKLVDLFIFNVYCPNAGTDRLEFKLNFLNLLEQKAKKLIQMSDNSFVIIMGDINISHRRIDHCEPYDEFESDPSRQWLTKLLTTDNPYFIDVFRHLYPNRSESYTCWNTQSGARLTNFGTRIDYIIADFRLKNYIKDCIIMSDILGSDHCPVMVEFDSSVRPIASTQLSKLCTKVWPEFGNCKQSTLTRFLCNNKTKNSANVEEMSNNSNERRNTKKSKTSQQMQTNISKYFINNKNKITHKNEQNSDTNELGWSQTPELDSIEDNLCLENSTGSSDAINSVGNRNSDSIEMWKNVFKSVPKAPLCSGHSEPCVLRRVNKIGSNCGKKFYVCARPPGNVHNKQSRCNYFKWTKDLK